jgi:hypothetical protein
VKQIVFDMLIGGVLTALVRSILGGFNLRHTDWYYFFVVLSLETCCRYIRSCLDTKNTISLVLHQQLVGK